MRFQALPLISLLLLLPIMVLAQPCLRGISTNPDNAINTECPDDVNVFDWRTPTFTTTDLTLPNGEIASPYWLQSNPPLSFLYNPISSAFHDFEWEEGWELISVNMNYAVQGFAYIIVYNKYESLIRVFTTLPVLGQNSLATLHLFFGNGYDNLSALLSPVKGYSQTLDQTSVSFVEMSSRYTNNSYRFVYFDIPVEYDPCTCSTPANSLTFSFGRMNNQRLGLYGRYVRAGQLLASIIDVGAGSYPEAFLANINKGVAGISAFQRWKEVINFYRKLSKSTTEFEEKYAVIKTFDDVLELALKEPSGDILTSLPTLEVSKFNADEPDSDVKISGKNAAESFFGSLNLFGTGIKKRTNNQGEEVKEAGSTALADAEFILWGNRFNRYLDGGVTVLLPGNNNLCTSTLYPLYNEVLGRMAMLRKPIVNINVGVLVNNEGADYIKDYRMKIDPSSINYVFNPAIGIDEAATSMYGFLRVNTNGDELFQAPTGNMVELATSPGVYITPMMPLECMGEFTAGLSAPSSSDETLVVELVLIVEYVFDNGYSSLQQYTYPVIEEKTAFRGTFDDFNAQAPAATQDYPSTLELETQHFATSQTIFAWSRITINGKLTAAPGVQVNIISPKIILNDENNASVDSNFSLLNDVTPFNCSPLGASTENLSDFCQSSTYKADKSSSFHEEEETEIEPEIAQRSLSIAPNPMGNYATITLSLPEADVVSMFIYDARGRLVRRLFSDRTLMAGRHLFNLAGTNLPAAMYVLSVQTKTGLLSARFIRQ